MQIADGLTVTLHFSLCLADGRVIDSTRERDPATFRMGDGTLPDGFERVLIGLEAGADQRFDIPPEQAFGDAQEDNVKLMPRDRFDPGITLEPGVVVSFTSPDGDLPGVIRSLQADLVVVDFNHPLAGKSLIFEVSIIAVGTKTDPS